VLEEGAYAKLSKWILTGFPTSTTPNMNAMSVRLLERFSSSLPSAKYPSSADAPPNLRAFRRKVELSFDVLKNIEENANSALTEGNVSPVRGKKGKAVTSNRRVDPLPFDSMGIAVPTTDAELRDVYVRVLSQLQGILEVCGFIVNSLCIDLNNPSTISSFLGSRCYRGFSNPRTSMQTYHRREGQINLRTQHFLGSNR